MKQSLGSLDVLTKEEKAVPKHLRLDETAYRELLMEPYFFALLENEILLKSLIIRDLNYLNQTIIEVVGFLDGLSK